MSHLEIRRLNGKVNPGVSTDSHVDIIFVPTRLEVVVRVNDIPVYTRGVLPSYMPIDLNKRWTLLSSSSVGIDSIQSEVSKRVGGSTKGIQQCERSRRVSDKTLKKISPFNHTTDAR